MADSATGHHTVTVHQSLLEQTAQTTIRQMESSQFDVDQVRAESLEKILSHKLVREKLLEIDKKLESLRRKHDKEKIKILTQELSPLESNKKPMFNMANKLVKRLSNKSIEIGRDVPPCLQDPSVASVERGEEGAVGYTAITPDSPTLVTRKQHERMAVLCREFSSQYREMQEKNHEVIYSLAEKIMRNSQANQMKQLKASLDRVTDEVMHQLQKARRNEVKHLSSVHRDRDELVRMKREVDSSVVERGVAERVRLKQTYDKCTDELQNQHEAVRIALVEHREKTLRILEKEAKGRTCIPNKGFLVLFQSSNGSNTNIDSFSAVSISKTSNNIAVNLNSGSPARSATNITNNNFSSFGRGDLCNTASSAADINASFSTTDP